MHNCYIISRDCPLAEDGTAVLLELLGSETEHSWDQTHRLLEKSYFHPFHRIRFIKSFSPLVEATHTLTPTAHIYLNVAVNI